MATNAGVLKTMIAAKEKQREKLRVQLITIEGELEGLRRGLAVIEGADTVARSAGEPSQRSEADGR